MLPTTNKMNLQYRLAPRLTNCHLMVCVFGRRAKIKFFPIRYLSNTLFRETKQNFPIEWAFFYKRKSYQQLIPFDIAVLQGRLFPRGDVHRRPPPRPPPAGDHRVEAGEQEALPQGRSRGAEVRC